MASKKVAKKRAKPKTQRTSRSRKVDRWRPPPKKSEKVRKQTIERLRRAEAIEKLANEIKDTEDSDTILDSGVDLKRLLSIKAVAVDPLNFLTAVKHIFFENPYLKRMSKDETARAKALYLQKIAETGRNDLAAKTAGVPAQAFFVWKHEDPEFAEMLQKAKDVAAAGFEDAAVRRGIHGTLKPIYQQGLLVGHERQYSDTMLGLVLKGSLPEKYGNTDKDDRPTVKRGGLTAEQADKLRAEILGVKRRHAKKGDE